jgi:GTP cyclohydrolase I
LDVVDVVPAQQLEFVNIGRVLDSVDVVVVKHIATVVVCEHSLASRAVDVIVAAVDDIAAAVSKVNTVAVDEGSGG